METTYRPSPPCPELLPATRVAPISLGDELARLAGMVNDLSVTVAVGSLPRTYDMDATKRVVANLRAEAEAMPLAEDVECGYDGDVDAHYNRRDNLMSWVCPRCGADREEEPPGPDPDEKHEPWDVYASDHPDYDEGRS